MHWGCTPCVNRLASLNTINSVHNFEGWVWVLIASVPDLCILFYLLFLNTCRVFLVILSSSGMFAINVIQSVQKETQTFKCKCLGMKIINFQNDSISAALPFNKELYHCRVPS